MTKHTPSPWTVNTVKTSIGHAHKIVPINACIYVDHRGIDGADEKTVEAAANARLVAAAPDMLVALKAMRGAIYEQPVWFHAATIESYIEAQKTLIANIDAMIDAAIKKATGED